MKKEKLCKVCNKVLGQYMIKTCSYKCKQELDKQKKKKVKVKKQESISYLSKQADQLWSKVVRIDGICKYCGKTEFLNAHHLIGRQNKNTRWELSNGCCLCAGCHTFSSEFSAHKNPLLFQKWLESELGNDYINNLLKLSQIPLKVTNEYLKEKITTFKMILEDL